MDSATAARSPRNWILFAAKLVVSLGLIAYLAYSVDWRRAAQLLGNMDMNPLVIALPLPLVGLGAAACRWRLILRDSLVVFTWRQAYEGYLLGAFYSIFLPGVIGGDAIRIGRCVGQTNCKAGTAAASVVLERMIGLVTLLGMGFLSYLVFPDTLATLLRIDGTPLVVAIAALGTVAVAAGLSTRRSWLGWLHKRIPATGLWRGIQDLIAVFLDLRGRTLGVVFLLSALFQGLDVLVTFSLSEAIGLGVPLSVFFGIMPIIYTVTILPVSLGGLGVREGALTVLLAQFGVDPSDAVTLAFLVYLIRVTVGSLGGLLQLTEVLRGQIRGRRAGHNHVSPPSQENNRGNHAIHSLK